MTKHTDRVAHEAPNGPRALRESPIGRRVLLKGDHPWAGQAGRYVGMETNFLGTTLPVVELDLGERVCVSKPSQWSFIE